MYIYIYTFTYYIYNKIYHLFLVPKFISPTFPASRFTVQDAASSAICGTVELTDDPQLGVMEVIIGPSFDPGKLEGSGQRLSGKTWDFCLNGGLQLGISFWISYCLGHFLENI